MFVNDSSDIWHAVAFSTAFSHREQSLLQGGGLSSDVPGRKNAYYDACQLAGYHRRMKKRYSLSKKVIDHVFKSGGEANDGSGGHATQDMNNITEYAITHIPPHKKGEAEDWKKATNEKAVACPFAHIATYKRSTQKYIEKSMFPGHVTRTELIKTIERALSSTTKGHTYPISSSPLQDDGTRTWIRPSDWRRKITDHSICSGDYVKGRANGITVVGQVKGHADGEDLTSAFPHTVGFYKIQ